MPQATGLAAELEHTFRDEPIEVELVPGDAGAFEVTKDGRLVFSKLRLGRFPAYQEIPRLLLD